MSDAHNIFDEDNILEGLGFWREEDWLFARDCKVYLFPVLGGGWNIHIITPDGHGVGFEEGRFKELIGPIGCGLTTKPVDH